MRINDRSEIFSKREELYKALQWAEIASRHADRAHKRSPTSKTARHTDFRRRVVLKLRAEIRALMEAL